MNKRPDVYTAACVLSFAGGTIAALAFTAVALFYPFFAEKIKMWGNELSMAGTSPLYFGLLALAHALSVLSVLLLWRGRKNGFFLYLLAQLLVMFLPPLFIGGNAFSSINAIFALVFVAIYGSYYWRLKQGVR